MIVLYKASKTRPGFWNVLPVLCIHQSEAHTPRGHRWDLKSPAVLSTPLLPPNVPLLLQFNLPNQVCVKKAWWVSVSTLLLQRRKCRSWKVTHPIQTRPAKEEPGGDFNPGSPAPAPIRCQLCCAASCLSSEASWTGRSSCEARWSNARPRY